MSGPLDKALGFLGRLNQGKPVNRNPWQGGLLGGKPTNVAAPGMTSQEALQANARAAALRAKRTPAQVVMGGGPEEQAELAER